MPINVILVDDHLIYREGVRCLLDNTPDIHIIGEASNGMEALDLIQRMSPEVVVLDLLMPGMNGFEVIKKMRLQKSSPAIVVLSLHSDEEYIENAFHYGVCGYILKENAATHLSKAIRSAAAGKIYNNPL